MSARSANDVLAHHMDMMRSGALDGILSDYADNAVMVGPAGRIQGIDALREYFTQLLAAFPPGRSTIESTAEHAEGDVAYIAFTAVAPGIDVPMGTDTFIVRHGMIAYQTYAYLAIRDSG